jgi:hypothetical protein
MSEMPESAIRVTDYYSAAEWVRAQQGSCTSPMAVELRMEDVWRVATTAGPAVVRIGDFLAIGEGGIEHVRAAS